MAYVVLSVTKVNGRKYTVLRHPKHGILLQINDKNATQSIGGVGVSGFYYDEIARHLLEVRGVVLLLGTAGGTIARRVKEMGGQAEFYGVDNDPEMIRLGRLFFNLDKYVSKVFISDARKFVLDYSPGSFDAVVDDVYVDSNIRVTLDGRRLVKRGGLYIQNDLATRGVLVETISE